MRSAVRQGENRGRLKESGPIVTNESFPDGKAANLEQPFKFHILAGLRYHIYVLFCCRNRTNRFDRSAFLLRRCCDRIIGADPKHQTPSERARRWCTPLVTAPPGGVDVALEHQR